MKLKVTLELKEITCRHNIFQWKNESPRLCVTCLSFFYCPTKVIGQCGVNVQMNG